MSIKCSFCRTRCARSDEFVWSKCSHSYCKECVPNLINQSLSLLNETPRCCVGGCGQSLSIENAYTINNLLLPRFSGSKPPGIEQYDNQMNTVFGFIRQHMQHFYSNRNLNHHNRNHNTSLLRHSHCKGMPEEIVCVVSDYVQLSIYTKIGCLECNALGYEQIGCSACDARGYTADCTQCSDGIREYDEECAHCEAVGYEEFVKTCKKCQGRGKKRRRACDACKGALICQKCSHGSGQFQSQCNKCSGSGKYIREVACRRCDGDGTVSVNHNRRRQRRRRGHGRTGTYNNPDPDSDSDADNNDNQVRKQRRCFGCKGTGIYTIRGECNACKGAGVHSGSCFRCNGSGKCNNCHGLDPDCTHCQGRGSWVVRNKCQECDGACIFHRRITCEQCRGSGLCIEKCAPCHGVGSFKHDCGLCGAERYVLALDFNKVRNKQLRCRKCDVYFTIDLMQLWSSSSSSSRVCAESKHQCIDHWCCNQCVAAHIPDALLQQNTIPLCLAPNCTQEITPSKMRYILQFNETLELSARSSGTSIEYMYQAYATLLRRKGKFLCSVCPQATIARNTVDADEKHWHHNQELFVWNGCRHQHGLACAKQRIAQALVSDEPLWNTFCAPTLPVCNANQRCRQALTMGDATQIGLTAYQLQKLQYLWTQMQQRKQDAVTKKTRYLLQFNVAEALGMRRSNVNSMQQTYNVVRHRKNKFLCADCSCARNTTTFRHWHHNRDLFVWSGCQHKHGLQCVKQHIDKALSLKESKWNAFFYKQTIPVCNGNSCCRQGLTLSDAQKLGLTAYQLKTLQSLLTKMQRRTQKEKRKSKTTLFGW